MDVYLVSRIPSGGVNDFVAQVEARGSSFLGPQYETTVRTTVGAGPISTVVTIARNSYSPLPEYFFADESTIYIFSGYLVDGVTSTTKLKGWFPPVERDDRPILRSPGGIYSFVTIRRSDGQVCAGHSTPTLEPIYYTETPSGVHVGNHPLLVHVVSTGMDRPKMDESFYFAAVNAGTAIDGSTPFLGCYRLPPRSVLISQPATFATRIRPAPRPLYGRYRLSTFWQRRDAVCESLIEAGSVLKTLPRGELRTSGGKDSRLVAASLSYTDTAVTPVNQSLPSEVEGQIADKVARVLGHESCLRIPREKRLGREEIERNTRRKIAFAGGLPAVASLQYPNASEGTVPGPPVIMGLAHLQRGGLNARIRSHEEAVAATSLRTVSRYLRPDYAERNARIVREFVNETLVAEGVLAQNIAFHADVQFPLNFQFPSLYAYVRNWNPLITPMVDERFVLLCEDIVTSGPRWFHFGDFAAVKDLRDEWIAMSATQALAPALLEFPLAGARYRCDSPQWRHFALRDPDLVKPGPISPDMTGLILNTRRTRPEVRAQLWEQIEGTVVEQLAEMTCRPEVWRYVSEPNTAVPTGESQILVNQFVWRLYGLSLILGSDWWSELAKAPDGELRT